jgi:hypothetical protein
MPFRLADHVQIFRFFDHDGLIMFKFPGFLNMMFMKCLITWDKIEGRIKKESATGYRVA